MKDKSNTHAFIKIWMKACFEKLMNPEKPDADQDPSRFAASNDVAANSGVTGAKFSAKTRQDT
jgi:hypothetical protein